MRKGSHWAGFLRHSLGVVVAAAFLGLTPLLGACDISLRQQVVLQTPTPVPPLAVVASETPLVGATVADTPDVQASVQALMAQTQTAQPTTTPIPPTATLVVSTPDMPATLQAAIRLTEAAAPTSTAAPSTNTPVPSTATPKATAKPPASLTSYRVVYGDFSGGAQSDENRYTVWMMRGDGSQAGKILDKGFEPAFSLDGKKVAYYHCWTGIRVYDLGKKTDVEIAPSSLAEFASFSPDGSRLVYHEWVGNWWSATVNLYTINADGSGKTQLPVQGMRSAWSPKGDLISYDSCAGSACGIFVVQPTGGGVRQLTMDGGGKANWAPDGKKLVYGADSGGNPEIFVVNVDGSGRKQLTHNSGNDTLPVYSPDGQWIYWLSDQNGSAWAILAMRPDGSDVRAVRGIGVPDRWQFSRLWVVWW